MTAPRILVLNAGSSSLKAGLVETPETTLARADVDWGSDASRQNDRADAVRQVLGEVRKQSGVAAHDLDAVGHRVVHGGSRFSTPALIDDAVINGIREVSDLAPLHNGVALDTIEAGRLLLPHAPHVACFDTAFHSTLAADAYRYPVPEQWYREWGLRRFGFHGLSVAWSVGKAATLLGRSSHELSLVVAHLGGGCSATAVEHGRSVDTSMGLTPLEGLMMGTRSGSVDPGLPLHLLRSGLLDVEQISEALDHESGLSGVSGIGSDMRTLQAAAETGDARAELAIAMFVRRAAAWIAAMATSLSALDGIVFTGGIGEHSDPVRRLIVERLSLLGLAPLPPTNRMTEADGVLSAPGSAVPVLRIEAREDLVIAAQTTALLAA
jgi:acetate kinase